MDYLGNTQAADWSVPTISVEELKKVTAYTNYTRPLVGLLTDKMKYEKGEYLVGGDKYYDSPWNWIDVPRNHLETRGRITHPHKAVYMGIQRGSDYQRMYKMKWSGAKVFKFADPNRYIHKLELIKNPYEYIEYLKYAPLAGFRIGDNYPPPKTAKRGEWDKPYNGQYSPRIPDRFFTEEWEQVLGFYILGESFFLLRAGQLEDYYDLYDVYKKSKGTITELISRMDDVTPIQIQPANSESKPFWIELRLAPDDKKTMRKAIKDLEQRLLKPSQEKVAERVIELSDPDATIEATDFSLDESQNVYLVYDPKTHSYINTARNLSKTFKPKPIAADPASLKYWQQVPDFEEQHERKYMTNLGLMSASDIATHGLDGRKKTNWIPWLAAGAAVAYAATEVV